MTSKYLKCSAPDCPVVVDRRARNDHASGGTYHWSDGNALREYARTLGWLCIPELDLDLCPEHHTAEANKMVAQAEPLTLDKLDELARQFAALPPAPFFASSIYWFTDKAITFTLNRRDYVAAHPDFWARVAKAAAGGPPGVMNIPVYNVDADPQKRREFHDAMWKAMEAKAPFAAPRALAGLNTTGN